MGVGIGYIIGIDRNAIRVVREQASLKTQTIESKDRSQQCGEPHDEYPRMTVHEDYLTHDLPNIMKVEFLFKIRPLEFAYVCRKDPSLPVTFSLSSDWQ